jgi:hypothetical protein
MQCHHYWRRSHWRSLAKVFFTNGLRVLVFDRETTFKDRVRLEQIHCLGVADARQFMSYRLVLDTCGNELWHWDPQLVGFSDIYIRRRDLAETSPHRTGWMNFYHSEMQTVVIAAAEKRRTEQTRWTLTSVMGLPNDASARYHVPSRFDPLGRIL